jgi:hypothetical protein
MAHGGFGTSTQPKQGIMVLDVPNGADRLSADVRIRTTTATPGQPTVVPTKPRDALKEEFQNGDIPDSYVVPKLDGVTDWGTTDWVVVNATYLGGVGSMQAGTGATVELYLFNDDGSPTGSLGSPVCAPCTYALGNGGTSGAPRNVAFRFPPAPTASGEGFAVVRVTGANPGAVSLEATGVDSIPGAFPMLVITGTRALEPLPPPESTVGVNEPDVPGAALALRGSPNPATREMTFAFDLVRATSVDLDVFDTAGRRVATVAHGWRAAGHHDVRWDRRDGAGRTLAAGIYYGHLRAGDGSRMTRLVLLPE